MKRTTNPLAVAGETAALARNVGTAVGLLTDARPTAELLMDLAIGTPPRRAVAVNDAGHVIGQDHHRARLTDHDVQLIRELLAEGLTQRQVAEKFEVSLHTVNSIACGRRRAQLVTGQRAYSPRT